MGQSSLQTHVLKLIPSPQAAYSLTRPPLHVLISMLQRKFKKSTNFILVNDKK